MEDAPFDAQWGTKDIPKSRGVPSNLEGILGLGCQFLRNLLSLGGELKVGFIWIFAGTMAVYLVLAIVWKGFAGLINLVSGDVHPPPVPYTEQVAAELRKELSGSVKVWNREPRHPEHPDYKWVVFDRDPEDPLYQFQKTERRKVYYSEYEFRTLFSRAFSVDVIKCDTSNLEKLRDANKPAASQPTGELRLEVELGKRRRKYTFFHCMGQIWRCEFMFRDPSWRKAVRSQAWLGSSYSNEVSSPYEAACKIAEFLVDLPNDIQDARFQKPEKLRKYEANAARVVARETALKSAEEAELKLWLASGKSKKAYYKHLKREEASETKALFKEWDAAFEQSQRVSKDGPIVMPPSYYACSTMELEEEEGEEGDEQVEVDDGYGEDAPDERSAE